MAKVTIHTGCPTESCEDGVHYVEVEYDFCAPYRHFDGEWKGSDDCECELTDDLRTAIVEGAEEMVATGEVY